MKWTRGRLIGQGSTANVSTATIYPNGEIVAIKSIEVTRSKLFQNEQKIHSSIRCPYIIEYKGQDVTFENGRQMYNILMEFASSGSLAESIAKSRLRFDEATISCYTRSILKGLEYLHSNRIVHCDIKPSNVLVTVQDGVKIADFGCAKLVDDMAGSNWSISGTPIYMAPEVARGEQQGYPADVWALGCTVIEMATGKAPWSGYSDPVSSLYQIGFTGQVPEFPEFMSIEGKDFLKKCLNSDPEKRLLVKELLQHPFVAETNPDPVTKLNPGHGSPTSVLDIDLGESKWDEVSELCSARDDEDPTRVLKSEERIRNLVEPGSSVNGFSNVPEWDPDDESWVTVRSYTPDTIELESSSFDVENDDENSFIYCLGHNNCNIIFNGGAKYFCFNLLQFESMYMGFISFLPVEGRAIAGA